MEAIIYSKADKNKKYQNSDKYKNYQKKYQESEKSKISRKNYYIKKICNSVINDIISEIETNIF